VGVENAVVACPIRVSVVARENISIIEEVACPAREFEEA